MLNDNQKRLLTYLVQPRTAKECAEYLGYRLESIYKHLRLLQRLELVEKHGTHENALSTFVWNGRAETPQIQKILAQSGDFMRYHDPFNQCPQPNSL